jgi:hypothetical protein
MISKNAKVGELVWFAGEAWFIDGPFGGYTGQTLFADPQMALLIEREEIKSYAILLMFPAFGRKKEALACAYFDQPICNIWKISAGL